MSNRDNVSQKYEQIQKNGRTNPKMIACDFRNWAVQEVYQQSCQLLQTLKVAETGKKFERVAGMNS
jgi:hypothetical protein